MYEQSNMDMICEFLNGASTGKHTSQALYEFYQSKRDQISCWLSVIGFVCGGDGSESNYQDAINLLHSQDLSEKGIIAMNDSYVKASNVLNQCKNFANLSSISEAIPEPVFDLYGIDDQLIGTMGCYELLSWLQSLIASLQIEEAAAKAMNIGDTPIDRISAFNSILPSAYSNDPGVDVKKRLLTSEINDKQYLNANAEYIGASTAAAEGLGSTSSAEYTGVSPFTAFITSVNIDFSSITTLWSSTKEAAQKVFSSISKGVANLLGKAFSWIKSVTVDANDIEKIDDNGDGTISLFSRQVIFDDIMSGGRLMPTFIGNRDSISLDFFFGRYIYTTKVVDNVRYMDSMYFKPKALNVQYLTAWFNTYSIPGVDDHDPLAGVSHYIKSDEDIVFKNTIARSRKLLEPANAVALFSALGSIDSSDILFSESKPSDDEFAIAVGAAIEFNRIFNELIIAFHNFYVNDIDMANHEIDLNVGLIDTVTHSNPITNADFIILCRALSWYYDADSFPLEIIRDWFDYRSRDPFSVPFAPFSSQSCSWLQPSYRIKTDAENAQAFGNALKSAVIATAAIVAGTIAIKAFTAIKNTAYANMMSSNNAILLAQQRGDPITDDMVKKARSDTMKNSLVNAAVIGSTASVVDFGTNSDDIIKLIRG